MTEPPTMRELAPGLHLAVADCFEALREIPDASVDAIVTDPPYGINFMGKAWDGAAIQEAASRPRDLSGVERLTGDPDHPERRKMTGRTGSAFANRAGEAGAYDFSVTGNRAFQAWVEQWATECLRILKPGGHALVFGGTRTYHRLASGLEDAGFDIRDCLAWMFGSGFPKSLDVGDGWGTALKPAFEPIVMARKPIPGTVTRNVLEHGTGGLNIDGCRVEFQDESDEAESKDKNRHADFGSGPRENAVYGADDRARGDHGNYDPPGRWPANVLLGHADDCIQVGVREVASDGHYPAARPSGSDIVYGGFSGQDVLEERSTSGELATVWDCAPDCAVRILDEQTAGRLHQAGNKGGTPRDLRNFSAGERGDTNRVDEMPASPIESGVGASRFFYCAKVSRAERSAGLDGFEERQQDSGREPGLPGGDNPRNRGVHERTNHHPTVKPIALMRWLVRLVTPPGGLVVDPFTGSGSTGCAAALEGMRFLGIERETDYAAIATARIQFWIEHGEETLDVVARLEAADRVREAIAETGQLDLLGGLV